MYQQPEELSVEIQGGRDVDYNWRYCVPEFHYGYMPKESPVTVKDFEIRWYNNRNTHKLLGRHKFGLM